MTQYRMRVNDTWSEITSDYTSISERWELCGEIAESRGGIDAVLERRDVFEAAYPSLWHCDGFIILGDKAVGQWEIIAEMRDRQGIIVG